MRSQQPLKPKCGRLCGARQALLVLFSLFALAACHPAPSPPANRLGVHLLLDDGRHSWPVEVWPEHLHYARQVAGEWGYVTELVRSDDLDPVRWQVFFDLCADLHLTPILRLAIVYDIEHGWWLAPTPDPDGGYRAAADRYAEFVAALNWPTDTHIIVVGNEPNHGNEWGGRPDPAAYARFLIDVADALHAADPEARVLNGGFDPYTPHTGSVPWMDGMSYMDEESFMDGMVAAHPTVFAYIDGWASHPYPLASFAAPPWEQTYQVDWLNGASNPAHIEPPPGIGNRGVNGYEWELFKLATYGVRSLSVYITETGWRHVESTHPDAADHSPGLPDAQTAADYLDLALWGNGGRYPDYPEDGWIPWLADPRVVAITPFALDGNPVEWGHTNWLMVDEDGRVLGCYPIASSR
ncbi:MAG: hypothetical protein JXB07_12255 [Anaerolineae bacterium]|nr:hypothetical protein [Anaerolineae bacterium]